MQNKVFGSRPRFTGPGLDNDELFIKSRSNVDLLQRKVDLLRRSSTLALFELDHVLNGANKGGINYKKLGPNVDLLQRKVELLRRSST